MSSSAAQSSSADTSICWADIAPREHIAQFYETDDIFLQTLTSFVGEGLKAGESAIVIAIPPHLRDLSNSLSAVNIDLLGAMAQDRYITLDAKTTLSMFMVNGMPDEALFARVVESLIRRAGARGRRVRAFGEMAALLWARGEAAATVSLERLWHRYCHSLSFSLLCSYPKAGFAKHSGRSLVEICAAHSRVI